MDFHEKQPINLQCKHGFQCTAKTLFQLLDQLVEVEIHGILAKASEIKYSCQANIAKVDVELM